MNRPVVEVPSGHITLPATALTIGRSYRRTMDMIMRGELRGLQVDGRWMVDLESVRAWLDSEQQAAK
jgi:hypothetical protein